MALPQSSYIETSENTTPDLQLDEPVPSQFALEKLVGKSVSGSVFIVIYLPEATRYTMKVVNKPALCASPVVSRQLKDRRVLSKGTSPFIVKRVFRFDLPEKLVECVEFVEGSDLALKVSRGRLDEEVARFYAAEILLGLNWLHSQGVTYRELIPSNVLIGCDGHIKLSDFGISRLDGSVANMTAASHREYVAPEVLERDVIDVAMDYWSLGVLIYEMLAGITPIQDDSDNKQEYLKTLKQSKVAMKYWFSPEASDLLSRLLTKDVTSRQSDKRLRTFNEAKLHPFFSSIDWEGLLHREVIPPTDAFCQTGEVEQDSGFIMSQEIQEMLSMGFTFKLNRASLKEMIGAV
jgi:serine/threonine protein kinase